MVFSCGVRLKRNLKAWACCDYLEQRDVVECCKQRRNGEKPGQNNVWGVVMPAGFQVFNTGNTIQVDESYLNYSLHTKTTQVSRLRNIDGSGFAYFGCRVTIPAADSLVAVRSNGNYVGLIATLDNNGASWDLCIGLEDGKTAEFYIYRPGLPAPSTFGLQVFRGDSVLVFDALSKSLRIERTLAADYTSLPSTIALESSSTYGMIFSQWCGERSVSYRPFTPPWYDRITLERGPMFRFRTGAMDVVTNGTLLSDVSLVNGSRPGGSGIVRPFRGLVANLTNH